MTTTSESILYEFARFCEFYRAKTVSERVFCSSVVKHIISEFAEEAPTSYQEDMFSSILTKPGRHEEVVALLESRPSLLSGAKSVCDQFRESRTQLKKELELWPSNPEQMLSPDVISSLQGIAFAPLRVLGTPQNINLDFYRGAIPFRTFSEDIDHVDGAFIDEILDDAFQQRASNRVDNIFEYDDLFSWMFPSTQLEDDFPSSSTMGHYPLFRHPLRPYEIYWMQKDAAVLSRATRAITAIKAFFGFTGAENLVLATRSREWGCTRSEFNRAAHRFLRVTQFAHLLGLEKLAAGMIKGVAEAARTDPVCAQLLVQFMPQQLDVGTYANHADLDDIDVGDDDIEVGGDDEGGDGRNADDDDDDRPSMGTLGVTSTSNMGTSSQPSRRHTDPSTSFHD